MKTYSIGEISKITGISRDRLRNYEKIGIIKPQRQKENEYRRYTEHEIDKILTVELYRGAEMNLTDIKKICSDSGLEQVKELLKKKQESVEEEILHLKSVRRKTEELLDACDKIQNYLNKISVISMQPFEIVGELADYRSYEEYQKLFKANTSDEPIVYKMQRKLLFNREGIYENKMVITKIPSRIQAEKMQKYVYTVVKDGESNEDPMPSTFQKCIRFCRENGLTPLGEVYIGMLLLHCSDGSLESYLEIRGPIT